MLGMQNDSQQQKGQDPHRGREGKRQDDVLLLGLRHEQEEIDNTYFFSLATS